MSKKPQKVSISAGNSVESDGIGSNLQGETTAMRVRRNPKAWMETCATILDRSGRLITPKVNTFQKRVIDIYLWCRNAGVPCRIIILKPRRKGSSTVSLAIGYTHLRNFMAYGAILGDDLGTTAKLMECWNRYVEADRFNQWGNTAKQNRREFSHGSKVREETANDPRAGMGGDIHFLLASEAAHYRSKGKTSGEYVMQSIMNSVPNLPQSVVIMESTPNGAQGVFYQTWQAAADFEDFKAGKTGNGYIRVFAPWFEFADSASDISPGEAHNLMADLDSASQYAGERELVDRYQVPPAKLKWRRQVIDSPACNGDPRKFLQEYPTDAITCFLQSGQNRFDFDGMVSIASAISLAPEPRYGILEQPDKAAAPTFIETSKAEAWLRVWETPHEGRRYIGAADFMTGEQSIASRRETDCHAWGIARARYTDKENADHTAMLAAAGMPDDRTKDLDIVAERIAMTSHWYGSCLVAPEINNLHGMIELLRRHKCNVWNRKKAGTGKTVLVPGFQTTTSSKRQVVGELATLIREQELDLRCSRALAELRNFVTHPDGTEAAGDGWHDDWVMMLAILAHVLPAAAPMESLEAKLTREQRRINHYASRRTGSLPAECS
jgi:hypothetical protein